MKAYARSYVWWPGIDKEIELCVAQCEKCQLHQKAPPKATSPTWDRPTVPWDTIHLDFAGPVDGQVYLVVVDAYSKWLEVRAVRNMTSSTVICELRNIFATFGIPRKVMSDNGTAFISQEIKSFYHSNGITAVTSAPYHPATNGQAERMVQQLKKALAKGEKDTVKRTLARFLYKQHTTVHTATGKTPAWMFLGRELPSPLQRLLQRPTYDPPTTLITSDSTHSQDFSVGQAVWIRNFPSGRTWTAGVITRRLGPRSWMIDTEEGQERRHMDHIRPRNCTSQYRNSSTPAPVWDLILEPDEPSSAPPKPETSRTPPRPEPARSETHQRTSNRVRRPPERLGVATK